jgi:hypothetical protein
MTFMMGLLAGVLLGGLLAPLLRALVAHTGLDVAWQSLHARIKGWRTMLWGGLLTVAGPLIETLDALRAVDWAQFLTARNVALAAAGIGIVTLWLRWLTTGPVGNKDPA